MQGLFSIVVFWVVESGLSLAPHSFCYALLAATLAAWLPAGAARLAAGVGLFLGILGCGGMRHSLHHWVAWVLLICGVGCVMNAFIELLMCAPGGGVNHGMVLVPVSLA